MLVSAMFALPVIALAAIVSQQAAPLQIVVLKGEEAVNIIQQKTAVAPLVEIRDRNNAPVAGAVVTFSIEGGKVATFQGAASTVTVVTNAAGQATAGAMTPLSAGSFSIQVQAAFQGQTALATIAQSNVLAAAEAASGASAAAGTSSAAASGGAAGGGVSAATLGVIGAAVGGGALVATQVAGGSDAPKPSTPTSRVLTAPLIGTLVHNITTVARDGSSSTCTLDHALNATATLELAINGDSASGTFRWSGTDTQVQATCRVDNPLTTNFSGGGQVSGAPTALSFRSSVTNTGPADNVAGATQTVQTNAGFSGTFDGTTATGTFTFERIIDLSGSVTQHTVGKITIPLTLR